MAQTETEDKSLVIEKPTVRDVILQGDEKASSHLANVLIKDLVALQRMFWDENDETASDHQIQTAASHIVQVMMKGTSIYLPNEKQVPPPFLDGTGRFLRNVNNVWTKVDEDAAVDEVVKLLREKPLHVAVTMELDQTEPKETSSEEKKESTEDHDNGENDNVADDPNTDTAKDRTAGVPSGALSPTIHDIKLLHKDFPADGEICEELRKHRGNQRLLRLIQQTMFGGEVVKLTSSHELRVKATQTILKLCESGSVVAKLTKSRFLVVDGPSHETPSEPSWKQLSKTEAAEFVLLHVFSKLVHKDHSSAVADLQALIPSVGDPSEIASFLDYTKPSTVPIDEPTEFDVLFGRGGMTNNHAGNRRFRDIISLHRPDYVRAIKIEKPNVARRIVAAIRGGSPPGRFLRKNPKDLKWYDVGNKQATEKTSQALREKSQAEKNGKVASEGDVRKRLLEQALYEARATRMRLTKEANGASLGGSCLDPNTLTLLLPKYPAVSQSTGLRPYSAALASGSGSAGEASDATGGPKGSKEVQENAKKSLIDIAGNANGKPSILEVAVMADKNMPMDEASAEPSASKGVVDGDGNILVTENDILCGRGGLTNHHKGNKRFRDIVALHRPDYVRAPKIHKPAVARLIVRAIRNSDPPGRFLKKDDKTALWFDIGDKRAAEKASQALREKTPEERSRLRQEASSTTTTNTSTSRAPLQSFSNPSYVPANDALVAAVESGIKSAAKATDKDDKAAIISRKGLDSPPEKEASV